jgi:hypothetical protein
MKCLLKGTLETISGTSFHIPWLQHISYVSPNSRKSKNAVYLHMTLSEGSEGRQAGNNRHYWAHAPSTVLINLMLLSLNVYLDYLKRQLKKPKHHHVQSSYFIQNV